MKFANTKEATQFVENQDSATRSSRQMLAQRVVINRCMHDGAQWINGGLEMASLTATQGRRPTNWNPDTTRLVTTVNRIIKLVQECAAATFPDRMDVDVFPGDRETGPDAIMRAQVFESMVNAMIPHTGYLEAARTANFRRCIDGTHGIAWSIKMSKKAMPLRSGGVEMVDDPQLVTSTFDSMKLITDPYCQELDLDRHDTVIYHDVWTVDRLNQNLRLGIDPKELQTCGELWGMEVPNQSSLIHNRLYATLAMYSQTKGARVFQLHAKDETGRFGTMLVGVKLPREPEIRWINWDNQESPFGGNGLPLMLLHGYRRPDSMWSCSDVALLKDDQDRLNLLNTLFMRMLQNNAGAQWIVRADSIVGATADEARNMLNNRVYGVITVKSGSRDKPIEPPALIKHPEPPAFIQPTMDSYQEQMRGQVHRPDITAGGYKTHTSNATYQTALQGANQVLGGRTREDLTRHEAMLMVGLGTAVKLAQDGAPTMLSMLDRVGFTPEDYAVLTQADPYYPACEIRIRESSIKFESKEQKEQRLWNAVNAQALAPQDLKRALAELDIPLDDDDRAFGIEAQKAASRVIAGEEWQPRLLGDHGDMFIKAFTKAQFSKPARNDPETLQRLMRAVDNQTKFQLAQTQMMAQAAQPQQPQQPEAQPDQESPQDDQSEPMSADIDTLIKAIQMGSGIGAPQPMQAA